MESGNVNSAGRYFTGNKGAAQANIERFLNKITQPNQVVELRVMTTAGMVSSFYTNMALLAKDAIKKDAAGAKGCYYTLNPVGKAIPANAINNPYSKGAGAASDPDIAKRQLILIDADPTRPSNTNSTAEEKQLAIVLTNKVQEYLAMEFGYPEPIVADSGNGYHCLYAVDLPNDEGSRRLVENFLAVLSQKFSTPAVKIDTTVTNASRISKLYGTTARKGENTTERPHRTSSVISMPEHFEIVTVEQLQQVTALLEVEKPTLATQPYKKLTLKKAESLVNRLSPERVEDYGSWLKVGMALRTYGADGLKLWDSWSQRSAKYVAGQCAEKWATIQDRQELTIGSLVHWADTDDPKEQAPDAETAATIWLENNAEWLYDISSKVWFMFDGAYWKKTQDDDAVRQNQIKEALSAVGMKRNPVTVSHVIAMAKSIACRDFSIHDGNLINFKNGTFDIQANALRGHSIDDYLIHCLPFDYAAGATYPTIQRTIAETISDPIDGQAFMTHIGLALVRDTSLHKGVLLYGGKRSGKTTLMNLAVTATGGHADNFAPNAIYSDDLEGSRYRYVWQHSLLVAVDEMRDGAMRGEAEGATKNMLAHAGVGIRGIGRDAVMNNRWTAKMIGTTNDRPRYADDSGALTERLIIIECPHTRSDSEQDPRRLFDMQKELGGFVVDCIKLAQEAIAKHQYPTSERMLALRKEIEIEGDSVKSWVEDQVLFTSGSFTSTTDLFSSYESYCKANGLMSRSSIKLVQGLKANHPQALANDIKRIDGKQHRGLTGLTLRTDLPVTRYLPSNQAPF